MPGSSLIPFHRVLIVAGILFCAGMAWWMFSKSGDGSTFVTLGAVFAVLSVLLLVYLWNLRRVLGYRDPDER